MLRKILIANRGEIACRIIATCQKMGIATVAVYSDADKYTKHVDMAEEAIHIGGHNPQGSYLNIEKILTAAKRTGADAIHPGYSFLAEDAVFAYNVRSAGLTFVGPSPEAIEMMGNKRIARLILQNIPYLPSYVEDRESNEVLRAAAEEMGFPLVVQANADPNARTLRLINTREELSETAFDAARAYAASQFDDATLRLEKYVREPRLIRIQILGDHSGRIIAIGESESSIRLANHLLISESPSTLMHPELRRELSDLAVMIGRQIGYYSCGSIDFLMDENRNYYFVDMQPAIQPEHALTETVYSVDLVRLQIQIARGVALTALMPRFTDSDHFTYEPFGYAIQAHVHANETMDTTLQPLGRVIHWRPHEYVRTDSAVKVGDTIHSEYGTTLARVTTFAETRLEATRQLDYALARTQLLGIDTNLPLLRRILVNDDYRAGIITVSFVEEHAELRTNILNIAPIALIAVALTYRLQEGDALAQGRTSYHFQWHDRGYDVQIMLLNGLNHLEVQIANQIYEIEVWSIDGVELTISVNGYAQTVTVVNDLNGKSWVHTAEHTYVVLRTPA